MSTWENAVRIRKYHTRRFGLGMVEFSEVNWVAGGWKWWFCRARMGGGVGIGGLNEVK